MSSNADTHKSWGQKINKPLSHQMKHTQIVKCVLAEVARLVGDNMCDYQARAETNFASGESENWSE